MTDNTNPDNSQGTTQVTGDEAKNQQNVENGNNSNNNDKKQPIVDLSLGNADGDKNKTPQSDENNDSNQGEDNKNQNEESAVFEKTGDTGLDVALDFASKHGYTPDNPLIIAASNGDWSLLEADLATKGVAGYKEMLELGKKGFSNLVEQETKRVQEIQNSALSVFNGDMEYFNKVKEFASKNADAKEKAEFNAMFEAGPVQARAAMVLLKQAYDSASGTTVRPASAVQENTNVSGYSQGGGLSRAEFTQALIDLSNKIGSHNLNNSPEFKALQQRRLLQMRLDGNR